ncbi:hypothetical protein HanOQP8_Chr14g0543061 [Helianthus annuus]|nr:hypothetical protein HanIR_Chr14g0713471 [Helianthus annuus]KAJ0660926.1 hypothetical protein HanOQP8_Chr14g0543061 [Helianthus annuus]
MEATELGPTLGLPNMEQARAFKTSKRTLAVWYALVSCALNIYKSQILKKRSKKQGAETSDTVLSYSVRTTSHLKTLTGLPCQQHFAKLGCTLSSNVDKSSAFHVHRFFSFSQSRLDHFPDSNETLVFTD